MRVRRQPFEAVQIQALQLLHRPMSIEELVDELGSSLPSNDPDATLDWLLGDDRSLLWIPDGRFCRVDAFHDGLTLAHRLTAEEIERGVLFDRDHWSTLADFFGLVEVGVRSFEVASVYSEADSAILLTGLAPVLADCAPGSLCGLAATGSGLEFLPHIEELEPADDLLDAFRSAFEQLSDGRPAPLDPVDIVRIGLADDRSRWPETIPPLGELAAAAGLQVWRSQVAAPSFDWEQWRSSAPTRGAAVRVGLVGEQRSELATVVEDYRRRRDDKGARAPKLGAIPAAVLLSDPGVAEAFVLALTEYGDEAIDDVARYAREVGEEVDLDYRAGCRWVRSRAAAADDTATRERLLREALAIDPDFDPANADLGWLLFERSDFVEAYRRLSSAEVDSEILDLLAELTMPARDRSGRNDPCPCGSGKKYKRCHGGPVQPFADRIAALYNKAARPVVETEGIPQWWRWPVTWPGESADWRYGLDRLDQLGILTDILLTEGGGMTEFIERRASVLPADEVATLRAWAEVRRRVWRVLEIDPAADRVRLEPVGDPPGAPVELEGGKPARSLLEGQLVLARLLPVDDKRHRLFGGSLPVADAQLDTALELANAPQRSAEATARRYIEFAHLHQDPAETKLVCVGCYESSTEAIDRWLADNTVQPPQPMMSGDRAGSITSPDVDPGELELFVAYGDRMGVRAGPRMAIVSITEEAHREIGKRIAADLPAVTVVEERAVTMAVLRDEAAASTGHPPSLDWLADESGAGGGSSATREALAAAMIKE
ncbi:MAG: SEC-C domain-containing protein, partial [Acidimicrobiales bacterium]